MTSKLFVGRADARVQHEYCDPAPCCGTLVCTDTLQSPKPALCIIDHQFRDGVQDLVGLNKLDCAMPALDDRFQVAFRPTHLEKRQSSLTWMAPQFATILGKVA